MFRWMRPVTVLIPGSSGYQCCSFFRWKSWLPNAIPHLVLGKYSKSLKVRLSSSLLSSSLLPPSFFPLPHSVPKSFQTGL